MSALDSWAKRSSGPANISQGDEQKRPSKSEMPLERDQFMGTARRSESNRDGYTDILMVANGIRCSCKGVEFHRY